MFLVKLDEIKNKIIMKKRTIYIYILSKKIEKDHQGTIKKEHKYIYIFTKIE